MSYFYAILWFAVGLVLIFSISKEHKIFYFAGGFFIFLGGWWLTDALLTEIDLFAGVPGIILKCITGAALFILAVFFVRENRKRSREYDENKK